MSTAGHSMLTSPRVIEPTDTIDLSRKPWLSPAEAASYLSLRTVDALYSRMKRGTLPTWCWTKLGAGRTSSLRFSRAALDQFLEQQLSGGVSVGRAFGGLRSKR